MRISQQSGGNNKITLQGTVKVYATFLVAFLSSSIVSVTATPVPNSSAIECTNGTVSSGSGDDASSSSVCGTDTADVHVSVTGGWTISVSSSGTLNLDLAPTSSGTFSTVTDNLNIYTNIPTGYQLYLNSTSGNTDIYNNNVLDDNGNLLANLPAGTNANHFVATTGTKDAPVDLTNNTWGYSLDNSPTTFSKVALTNDDAGSNIYTNPTKTPSSGDNIPVTYGFKADTSLTPGTYSTSVTYTAIADAPTYTITSVSPSSLQQNDQTDKTITIMTSTPATELAFGNISAKIGTVDLTNCTEITSDGFRGATCTYTGDLAAGYYSVELTSSWHNATYTKTDGMKIGESRTIADITYMQEMNSDICKNSSAKQEARLLDSRGQGNGGSDKTTTYGIVKAIGNAGDEDSECWMTDNLNLYNVIISADVSDFTSGAFKIPDGITSGDQWNTNIYDRTMVEVAHGLGDNADKTGKYYGQVYYNWSSAVAIVDATPYDSPEKAPNTSICPKQWTLPNGGDANTPKSYAHLMDNYGLNSGQALIDNSVLGFSMYYGNWGILYGSEINQGGYGIFWTSTPSETDRAYRMRYSDSAIYSQETQTKGYGFNVRCVAR